MTRLKVLTAAAAFIALMGADASAIAAAGGTGGVQAAFGNTVISTYPDGRTGLLWIKADGTYDAMGRRRTSSSGTWTLRGGKVCLKQKKPKPAPFSYCTATPAGGIGAEWTGKAVTGEKIRIKLVRGRVK